MLHISEDYDYLLSIAPLPVDDGGVFSLWFGVMVHALDDILTGKTGTGASSFLFDVDNVYFDYIADCLGYSPEGLRERIQEKIAAEKRKTPA